MKKFLDSAFSPLVTDALLLCSVFLTELAPITVYGGYLFKAALVYALLGAVWNTVMKRGWFSAPLKWLPLAFVASYAGSVAANLGSPAAKQNIYVLIVCAVLMLSVYPAWGGRDELLRRLRSANRIVIVLTGAAAAAALVMFLFDVSPTAPQGDESLFYYGFVERRLAGLYKTATCAAPLAGIFAALCEFCLVRGEKKSTRAVGALICVSGALNFCQLALANSRALFYAAAAGTAVFTALAIFFRMRKTKSFAAAFFAGAGGAVLSAALVFGLIWLARYIASWAQPVALHAAGLLDGPIVRADLSRTAAPEGYGELSGRPAIWKYGLTKFLEKPVLGWASQTLVGTIETPSGTESVSHFHNIVVQALVCSGAVGTLILAAFMAGRAFLSVRFALKRGDAVFAALCAMLAAILVDGMAEVTTVFVIVFISFVYWLYTGVLTGLSAAKEDAA